MESEVSLDLKIVNSKHKTEVELVQDDISLTILEDNTKNFYHDENGIFILFQNHEVSMIASDKETIHDHDFDQMVIVKSKYTEFEQVHLLQMLINAVTVNNFKLVAKNKIKVPPNMYRAIAPFVSDILLALKFLGYPLQKQNEKMLSY